MGALGILLLVTAISDLWIAIWRDRHGRPSRMFIGAVGVFLSSFSATSGWRASSSTLG